MDALSFTESWIRKVIKKEEVLKHHFRARDYLLMLDPNSSLESQIAALTHDIERSLPDSVPLPKEEKEYTDEYLLAHGLNSAKHVCNYLNQNKFQLNYQKLDFLISNHEVGGDLESDLLKDADSLSFLEVLPAYFLNKYSK